MSDRPPASVLDPVQLACPALGPDASPREAELYVRYLRALALLCECAPYVDEPDYLALIDALLDDAHATYPLDVRKDGARRELAPRGMSDV